jgi:phosphatidylglycerophosphate synthase
VTDLFDGYFARRFQVTSSLGAYADPMTDKVFYLTAFPTLVYLADRLGQHTHARALLVLAILFLLRDQWVSFLRSLGALHNLSAKANWSGKARTLISFPTICVIYYYLQAPTDWCLRFPASLVYGLEGLSVAINLISIGVYTARFWPALRAEMRLPDSGKQEKD